MITTFVICGYNEIKRGEKRMKKVIVVNNCYYCPCVRPVVGGIDCDGGEVQKSLDKEELLKDKENYMPDWCPLEDYGSLFRPKKV